MVVESWAGAEDGIGYTVRKQDDEYCCPVCFLLFYSVRTPAQEMESPVVKVGLSG